MNSFYPSRGCVYAFSQSGASAGGFYALKPSIPNASGSPVLITGITPNEQSIVSPKVTLSGYKVLYSYGPDFGNIMISLLVLLGTADNGNGQGLQSVINFFETNRIDKLKAPISASLPGNVAYKLYLTAMGVGDPDPIFNILPVRFTGIIADLPTV